MVSKARLFVSLLVALLTLPFAQTTSAAPVAGMTDGVGTYFEVTDSLGRTYTFSSTDEVRFIATAVAADTRAMINLDLESAGTATSTFLTIGGLVPGMDYHFYVGVDLEHTIIQADTSGVLVLTVNLEGPSALVIKTWPSTILINVRVYENGGYVTKNDCSKPIGSWTTPTCTLENDVYQEIQLGPTTTLDGSGCLEADGLTQKNCTIDLRTYDRYGNPVDLGNAISMTGNKNNINVMNLNIKHATNGILYTGLGTSTLLGSGTISNNEISGCTYGLFSTSGKGNTITGNTISGSSNYNIYHLGSSSTFSGNTITGCTTGTAINPGTGIFLKSGTGNTFEQNTITGNSVGVELNNCYDQNTFKGNTIIDNKTGVAIIDSKFQNLYNNDFRNDNNVSYYYSPPYCPEGGPCYDPTIPVLYRNATWNLSQLLSETNIKDGPTIGGNFWAGYSDSADCTDNDNNGICDLSYNVIGCQDWSPKDGACDTPIVGLDLGTDQYPLAIFGNAAPVLDPIGGRTGRVGNQLQINLSATDVDSTTLTFTAAQGTGGTPLPVGWDSNFDGNTGVFSWTPGTNDAATYNIEFCVYDIPTDINKQRHDCETVMIVIDPPLTNRPPVFSSAVLTSYDISVGQSLTFEVCAYDPDGDSFSVVYDEVGWPPAATLSDLYLSTVNPPYQCCLFYWSAAGTSTGYTITFHATDQVIPPATADISVSVKVITDNSPPVIETHADVTTEATSAAGAAVSYTSPSATDAVDGSQSVSCSPASGSTFAIGTTTVTCTASDTRDNSASASFDVVVQDTTPPTLIVPTAIIAPATSASGAIVNFEATAVDDVDGTVPVSCEPESGTPFQAGQTFVSCKAKDNCLNPGPNEISKTFLIETKYNWTGFFQPVDNEGVINSVKAGSAIPVKFRLGGDMGLAVFETGYPKVVPYTLGTDGQVVTEITDDQTVVTDSNSFNYDPIEDQYVYVWKTNKAWARTNYQLQIKLKDGSLHVANFQFK